MLFSGDFLACSAKQLNIRGSCSHGSTLFIEFFKTMLVFGIIVGPFDIILAVWVKPLKHIVVILNLIGFFNNFCYQKVLSCLQLRAYG
jgi:hypothetical protein